MINCMINTLREIARKSFKNKETFDRKKWIENDPAQITLLVNNVIWSAAVEDCFIKIAGGDMNSLKEFLKVSIELLTELIRFVRGDLSRPMR